VTAPDSPSSTHPPSDPLAETISAIHDSPTRLAMAITGGGSGALSRLLAVPGASRTLLDAQVPYSANALTNFLGRQPDRFCDESTALAMAVVAYQRATRLVDDPGQNYPILGLAATASLASDRTKQGEHRALVALQTNSTTTLARLDLEKNVRSRAEEEHLLAWLIVQLLAEAAGVNRCPELALGEADRLVIRQSVASAELADLWNQRTPIAWSLTDGNWSPQPPAPPVGILSGSFAPRHQGHVQLQQVAETILGQPVYYEMTVVNADKPPLDFDTIHQRRKNFTDQPLAVTASPTFLEKARLFPGTTFVIGADTAARVIHPRFYDNDSDQRDAALDAIAQLDCRFLVAGRLDNGRFLELATLELPKNAKDLFDAIPASLFRCDIASSDIRNTQN
jgi:hypothetical protein